MALIRHLVLTAALLFSTGASVANPVGTGLQLNDHAEEWSRWRARLSVSSSPWAMSSVRLSGERYFNLGRLGDGGGLRAGGALLLGRPTVSLGTNPARLDDAASWHSSLASQDNPDMSPLPYVGLGYSAWWLRHGLGVSADLGLIAQRPAQGFRSLTGGSGLDDTVRALQLSPVLQVHLSFAF